MNHPYPKEPPVQGYDTEDTDDTLNGNVEELSEAIVGRKIVSAEQTTVNGRWGEEQAFVITLDNGRVVELHDTDDCCAFTQLESFLLNVDKVEHVIMGVGTTDNYEKWHIYADFGDILELTVGWSEGNPFYYGYGFDIAVKEPNTTQENIVSDQPSNPLEEITPAHLSLESAPLLDEIEGDDNVYEDGYEVTKEDEFPGSAEDDEDTGIVKPVVMKQGEEYVVVGHAEVLVHENETQLFITLDTEAGHDVGKLIATQMITGVSLGAILDPEVKAAFAAAAG